jgi:hypothetical protein
LKSSYLILGLAAVLAVLVMGLGHVSAQPMQTLQSAGGGRLAGSVYAYNMWNELIPLDWVPVTASNSEYNFTTYSYYGGGYGMYLPVGTYNVTAAEPGYTSYSQSVTISDGASLNGINFYLEESHIPVPEFPAQALMAIMILAFTAALLAKRATKRKN